MGSFREAMKRLSAKGQADAEFRRQQGQADKQARKDQQSLVASVHRLPERPLVRGGAAMRSTCTKYVRACPGRSASRQRGMPR